MLAANICEECGLLILAGLAGVWSNKTVNFLWISLKAFETLNREALWKVLGKIGVPDDSVDVNLIKIPG